jgi:Uma2 family endonuclease
MSQAARAHDVYAEWAALPDHVVGEVIHGQLYAQPRPALKHAQASSALGGELVPPFRIGRGGPGGWIILDEPELRLGARPDILVPDLAGWRRERVPELPDAAYFDLAPDWACEVLSPATQRLDRTHKRDLYLREHVKHLWLVDPDARTLEIFRLAGDAYLLAGTFADDARIRAEPFEAIELELGLLWAR